MRISETLLPEFDQEMASTRKILEVVPDGKNSWKPHPKSMDLGYLAVHIATLPSWATNVATQPEFNFSPPGGKKLEMPSFESSKKNLEVFDAGVREARAAIASAPDSAWTETWSLKNGEHTMFSMPRMAVYRGFFLNHLIHHRGQLSVYLRLNDVPLPSIYGPTADNPMPR